MWTLQPLVNDGRPLVKLAAPGATKDLGRAKLVPESSGHGAVHRLHATLDVIDDGSLKATQRGKTSIACKRGDDLLTTKFTGDILFLRVGDELHLLNPVTATKQCGYRVDGPQIFESAVNLDAAVSVVPVPSRGPAQGERVLVKGLGGFISCDDGSDEVEVTFDNGEQDIISRRSAQRFIVATASKALDFSQEEPRVVASAQKRARSTEQENEMQAVPRLAKPAKPLTAVNASKGEGWPAKAEAAKAGPKVEAAKAAPAHAQNRPPAQQAAAGGSVNSFFAGGAAPGGSSGQQRWMTAAAQQAERERREDAALFGDEPEVEEAFEEPKVEAAEAEESREAHQVAAKPAQQPLLAAQEQVAESSMEVGEEYESDDQADVVQALAVLRKRGWDMEATEKGRPVRRRTLPPTLPISSKNDPPPEPARAGSVPPSLRPPPNEAQLVEATSPEEPVAPLNPTPLLQPANLPLPSSKPVAAAVSEEAVAPAEDPAAASASKASPSGAVAAEAVTIEHDDDGDEEREEVFENYVPAKMQHGGPHPSPVVETVSLSFVQPPDLVGDEVHAELLSNAAAPLSALQLESIAYARQRHARKAKDGTTGGFFIGDGAGIGKGRQIAGIILNTTLFGGPVPEGTTKWRRHVWVSASTDLFYDAERDLKAIGWQQEKHGKLRNIEEFTMDEKLPGTKHGGVLYCTYSWLGSSRSEKQKRMRDEKLQAAPANPKAVSYDSRVEQLIEWCGGASFDGVLVFDEVHKVKNLVPEAKSAKATKCGAAAERLQKAMPHAKLVYVSATGASSVRCLAPMPRLGLWGDGTAFADFQDFEKRVGKQGTPALELTALSLKAHGAYLARSLSFQGASFEQITLPLTEHFRALYSQCAQWWSDLYSLGVFGDKRTASLFWGAHQRFFKQLCQASKVEETARMVQRALDDNYSVVIGLTSTSEAAQKRAEEDGSLEELCALKQTAETVLEAGKKAMGAAGKSGTSIRCMPDGEVSGDEDAVGDEDDGAPAVVTACEDPRALAKDLEARLEEFDLPGSPLDELIKACGGPSRVAEMTGRKSVRVWLDGEGKWADKPKKKPDNITEKDQFLSGRKLVAIISEAASTGISLHAARSLPEGHNRRRRYHITIELPWSAEQAVQQFGRSHRSNQITAPHYVLLLTDHPGEQRFGAAVSKRLQQLGALTKGDRRSCSDGIDLSKFSDLTGKWGDKALEEMWNALKHVTPPKGSKVALRTTLLSADSRHGSFEAFAASAQRTLLNAGFFGDKKQNLKVEKFLNKILGMPPDDADDVFTFFAICIDCAHMKARESGQKIEMDTTIDLRDRGSEGLGQRTLRKQAERIVHRDTFSGTETRLVKLLHDGGLAFGAAAAKLEVLLDGKPQRKGRLPGWYLSNAPRNGFEHRMVALAHRGSSAASVVLLRPNGRKSTLDADAFERIYEEIDVTRAEELWAAEYRITEHVCAHGPNCKHGPLCTHGKRQQTRWILDGCCLSLWNTLEKVQGGKGKVKLMRVVMPDDVSPKASQSLLSQSGVGGVGSRGEMRLIGVEARCESGDEFGVALAPAAAAAAGGADRSEACVEMDMESVAT